MKNQYFGDVGDYGKYALLRYLANNQIKLAINWYLTADDGSNDGKHITYLEKNEMKNFDPELFVALREMVRMGQRDIKSFEQRDMIPNAIYYSALLHTDGNTRDEKRVYRKNWHQQALCVCKEAELVFLDPDNGACEKEPKEAKSSIKYCYADEIADYFSAGQNVVYYCSKGRRTYEQWEETKELMKRRLPEAQTITITFHKGTQRSYIFVLHEEDYQRYMELIQKFLQKWPKIFTEEKSRESVSITETIKERFSITNSQGVELSIEVCGDGFVNIRFSDQKECLERISIDDLFGKLR